MKRSLTFLSLSLLCALSCSCAGQKSYAGTYVFQMGKEKSTHFAVSMQLFDEPRYSSNSESSELIEKGKSFHLLFNAEMVSGSSDIMSTLLALFPDGINLDGYYRVGKEVDKGKNQLALGFILSEVGGTEVQNLIDMDVSSDAIERFVYSEITSTAIDLSIPVSWNDLMFQLYWYGYDFYLENKGTSEQKTSYREIEHHEVGTHPTAEDVAKIKENYLADHETDYRDFHTITLGLTKQ